MDPEKTIEQLQQENDGLKAELELTKSVNDELTKKIEELSYGQPAIKEIRSTIPTETFDVGGVKYKFVTPAFVYKGQKITAEQALTDTGLLSELVEKGIGVITKVVSDKL